MFRQSKQEKKGTQYFAPSSFILKKQQGEPQNVTSKIPYAVTVFFYLAWTENWTEFKFINQNLLKTEHLSSFEPWPH